MVAKKWLAALFLVAFFALSLALPAGHAMESPADAKQVLVFLKDVIGLDLATYEVTLSQSHVSNYWEGLLKTNFQHSLQYWDVKEETYSYLKVKSNFVEATIQSCSLSTLSGSPLYKHRLPTNPRDAAITFLQRYQAYTGDSSLEAMQNILNAVDVTKNMTRTVEHLKLELRTDYHRTMFRWSYTWNGADYSSLILELEDGSFLGFHDSRSYRKIGSTEVHIPKEEAIEIALNRVEGFSYKYNGEIIDNFTIVKNQIRTKLTVSTRYKPQELYPLWMVDLPLDDVYPGFIYYLQVVLWADNGEVISFKGMGYGGPLPREPIDDPSGSIFDDSSSSLPYIEDPESSSETEDAPIQLWAAYVAVAAAAILIPPAIAIVAIKKRRNT